MDWQYLTRRTFLKQASAAAALGALAQLPGSWLLAAEPSDLLPDPDETLLRDLALRALDAARTAGATFADVRLAIGRRLIVSTNLNPQRSKEPTMAPPGFVHNAGYGVRVIVDGAWGFAGGYDLTPEGVAAAARAAVARARANRPRRPRTLELAPAPVVSEGRWQTPIVQDPWAVTVGDQADLQLHALAAIAEAPGVQSAMLGFTWQRTDRVFASSDGAFQHQRLDLALPSGSVTARASAQALSASRGVNGLWPGGLRL